MNLADNLISSVRWGLAGCKRLTALNLSGNPLASLQVRGEGGGGRGAGREERPDVTFVFPPQESRFLSATPSLRSLTLADPVYGVTPMARLCNYRSSVLLQLPHLRALDCFSVEPEELQQLRVREREL